MKLIIKEYLASLNEREQLDALLPDLLSQMGLNVFLKPSRGQKEHGVDIAAFGKLNDDDHERVFLFSVKSGDLGRQGWNNGTPNGLRPSLESIMDAFIPNKIPIAYKDYPVEICMCFGGDMKGLIREEVGGFFNKNASEKLTFSEWNGDHLAELIELYFLREDLLPKSYRSLLRKTLSMIDQPDIAYKNFVSLIDSILKDLCDKPKNALLSIRQVYISLWILYSWCREEDNLESIYLCSELATLNMWDISKLSFDKKDKNSISIQEVLHAILILNFQISNLYIETKVKPHVDKLYAISFSSRPSCPEDTNLKAFDILGKLALSGSWAYSYLQTMDENKNQEVVDILSKTVSEYQKAIIDLISNNPILYTPYKDEQAIDIALASWFLMLNSDNWPGLNDWLENTSYAIQHMLRINYKYPSTIQNYSELIEHPIECTDEYRKSVTEGAILYPYISIISAIIKSPEPYEIIKKIQTDYLGHCNFQTWFFNETSEDNFYRDSDHHGASLGDLDMRITQEELLNFIESECEESNQLYKMSAFKYGQWPIILTGCRHYRLPVPMHFFIDIYKQIKNFE